MCAEMAIWKVNEEGGLNGLPVQMVVRLMEGPWGTGLESSCSILFSLRQSVGIYWVLTNGRTCPPRWNRL